MTSHMIVHGSVKVVTCKACKSNFPIFEFEAETDSDMIGLCSASQCNGRILLIAETTLDEWKSVQAGKSQDLISRLRKVSGIADLQIIHVKRVERGFAPPAGASFAEFKKLYQSPVVIYSCPCCTDGEAIEAEEFTVSEFENIGGVIAVVGNLAVQPLPL